MCDGLYWYSYDEEGSRTEKYQWTDTDADGVVDDNERFDLTTYSWDARGRLIKITTLPDGSEATKTVKYSYDYLNRRVEKQIKETNSEGKKVKSKESYTYLGHDIVLQGNDGEQSHRYLHHPDIIDQCLADERLFDDNVLYPLFDNLNSVRDIADYDPDADLTDIVNSLTYSASGSIVAETNPENATIYGHAGQETDRESDLIKRGVRNTDPRLNVFISPDPIAFMAGDTNLYRYVANDPINHVDPTGNDYIKVVDGVAYWVIEENGYLYNPDIRWVTLGTVDGDTLTVSSALREGVTVSLARMEALADNAFNDYGDISDQSDVVQRHAIQGAIGRAGMKHMHLEKSYATHMVEHTASGLAIGGKAIANGTTDTVVSFATLGTVDGVELIAVSDTDRQFGYDASYFFARGSSELGLGLASGGIGNISKGGKIVQYTGRGVLVLDLGGNAVTGGRGVYDMSQNGVTLSNSSQVVFGGLGVVGNVAPFMKALPDEVAPSGAFRSDSDVLRDVLGPARTSHPDEYASTLQRLRDAGVDIDLRSGGGLAYSPRAGGPGRLKFDPDASIGALRHEARHFDDIADGGYQGLGYYMRDLDEFWRIEYRGYLEEWDIARQLGDESAVARILEQMRARRRELLGR